MNTGLTVELPDGFYVVVEDGPKPFCAGFVVEAGAVTQCAPILRLRWTSMPDWLQRGQVRYVGP